MKFLLLLTINFTFMLFSLTNVYCEEIKEGDIIPSTNLIALTVDNNTYAISMINDGKKDNTNGFASPYTVGTITLELSEVYDLNSFYLWNDIIVQDEGVREFRLDFFDINNTKIIGSETYSAASYKQDVNVANEYFFDKVEGVKKVNLVILLSKTQIEIRELEFRGEKHSFCSIIDTDKDGVIDQWDSCKQTPINSAVNSKGCQVIKGDLSNNGRVDIEDSIKILQLLAY